MKEKYSMANNNQKYNEPLFEENSEGDNQNSFNKRLNEKTVKKQFVMWLIGFAISLIPILALPLYHIIFIESTSSIFEDLFYNSEIIFVGISLTITSINDFITPQSKESGSSWMWINIITIIVGTLIFSLIVIAFEKDSQKVNKTFVIAFNIVYLVVCFLLGFFKYRANMKRDEVI